jgi:predicted metalloendopeptidase
LGDALGQKYIRKYFPEDAKNYAIQIVEEVKEALRSRLQEVDWMSEETRTEALKKLESFRVKIGYPVRPFPPISHYVSLFTYLCLTVVSLCGWTTLLSR